MCEKEEITLAFQVFFASYLRRPKHYYWRRVKAYVFHRNSLSIYTPSISWVFNIMSRAKNEFPTLQVLPLDEILCEVAISVSASKAGPWHVLQLVFKNRLKNSKYRVKYLPLNDVVFTDNLAAFSGNSL